MRWFNGRLDIIGHIFSPLDLKLGVRLTQRKTPQSIQETGVKGVRSLVFTIYSYTEITDITIKKNL